MELCRGATDLSLRCLCLLVMGTAGCGVGDTDKAESLDKDAIEEVDASLEPAATAPPSQPDWGDLPATVLDERLKSLQSEVQDSLNSVKGRIPPLAVFQIRTRKLDKRVDVASVGIGDLRTLNTMTEEACLTAIRAIHNRVHSVISEETQVLGRRIKQLEERVEWFRANAAADPQFDRYQQQLRADQSRLQSLNEVSVALSSRTITSENVVECCRATQLFDPVIPNLSQIFISALLPFDQTIRESNAIIAELTKWADELIDAELLRLSAMLKTAKEREDVARLVSQLQSDERDSFSGSDEDWETLRAVVRAASSDSSRRLRKGTLEKCLSYKVLSVDDFVMFDDAEVLMEDRERRLQEAREAFDATKVDDSEILRRLRVKIQQSNINIIAAEVESISAEMAALKARSEGLRNANKSLVAGDAVDVGRLNSIAIAHDSTAVAAPPAGQLHEAIGGITNSIGMRLSLVPAGQFTMGSPASEAGRGANEFPHLVTIAKAFYIGTYEVTQEQYQRVMERHQSVFRGAQNPVDSVTWDNAVMFCDRLTGLEKDSRRTYRLPTEAEWEYACRSGTTTAYCSGDTESALAAVGWYKANAGGVNHPVGQKLPNAWGIYDMHGNVFEWCLDAFRSYPRDSETFDPFYSETRMRMRVCRGGGAGGDLGSPPAECRSAYRMSRKEDNAGANIGFRVVMIEHLE